jgi:protein-disulfide isomerase
MTNEPQNYSWRKRWIGFGVGILLLGLISSCVQPVTAPAAATQPEATAAPAAAQAPAASNATTTTVAVTTTADVTATQPAVAVNAGPVEKHKDIEVGFTAQGYPYRGAANAPVTMFEYSDFQCPFCSRYFVQTEPAINDNFVRSGQLRVVFRDFPLAELHPNAPAAHHAALCVAEQGSAAKFWEMHDQLFQTQAVWANLPDPAAHFAKLAETIGVDLAKYQGCFSKDSKKAQVDQSLQEGQALGINGTPSFNFVRTGSQDHYLVVGAQPFDAFANMVNALVKGEAPPQAQQPDQQQGDGQIPFWATADGLKPDPSRPGFTVAGDEYRGNPEAKVKVVEFSDFQCPYCRRHEEATQPTLDKTFVDTNEIFWVFKHFPLSIHPQAHPASIAAECAADQGKFWAMHDLLFKNVESWSVSDPNPIFTEMSKQAGLDADKFSACLTAGDAEKKVDSDMQDGAPFVKGTPTFIVLFGKEGRIIPGALPVDRFTQALQQVVDSAK